MNLKVWLGILLLALLGFLLYSYFFPLKNQPSVLEITNTPKASIPPTQKVMTIAAAGDISCQSLIPTDSSCGQASTAQLINALNPDLVLALGDLQYSRGALNDFNNFYDKSWGQFKDKTKPVPGNHEYQTKNASGYFDYFGHLAGERGKGYYSFEKDNWKIYAINSNCGAVGGCGENSPQGKWLKEELAKDNHPCQLAFFHHPFLSSGFHGSDENIQPIWQILFNGNIDLVLNGHDHLYERFAPVDPKGMVDESRGITQFIIGTGGRNFYGFRKAIPASQARISNRFGVLKMDLFENSYSWQFIDITNQVLDSGSRDCH